MTAAQLVHFFIVIGLGILAFLTFLVAGTIVGLMIVEDSGCNCIHYPIGLFVLGLLWLLLLVSLIREIADSPIFDSTWIRNNQEAVALILLVLITLFIIL